MTGIMKGRPEDNFALCDGGIPPLYITSLNYKFPIDSSCQESIYHDGANYGGIHNQLVCYQTQIGKTKAALQRWIDWEDVSDEDTLDLLCKIFDIRKSK